MRMNDNAAAGRRGLRATPSPALLAAVCAQYEIATINEFVDLGGSSSLNLLVHDGERRYVLRVYRPYVTDARLEALHIVRRVLIAGGVPVSVALATRDGQPWFAFDGRRVEVEHYVDHDAKMDTWARLETALPMLGRIHTLLQDVAVGAAGKSPHFANHIAPADVLAMTQRGVQRIRSWTFSPDARQLADAATALAQWVTAAEREHCTVCPRQLVHGDFWDNNIFFCDGGVVLITDFDFMGERARIDDLALTLYFTSLQYPEHPVSDEQLWRLRRLVDAYDRGLANPLSHAERIALPLTLARQPLWSIGGWVALLDDEQSAYQHAMGTAWAVDWALGIMQEIDRWQTAFA